MFISLWLQIWLGFRHQGLVISSTKTCLYLSTGCSVGHIHWPRDMAVFFCVKVPVVHKWYVVVPKMLPNTWHTDQVLYSNSIWTKCMAEHLGDTFIWTAADKEIDGSCVVLSLCQKSFTLLVHLCLCRVVRLYIEVMEGNFHPLWRWLSMSESGWGLWGPRKSVCV